MASPNTDDVRISYVALIDSRVTSLDARSFQATMRLVSAVAGGLVWTYSPPSDGSLPDDDKKLARIARVAIRSWLKIRPDVEQFFEVRDGKWHLIEPWIEIGQSGRTAIPTAIQAEILAREGQICTYCGDTDGPFEFDHIFPVSRGGKNSASNLTLACAPCNRSKKARTLREWMEA